MMMDYGAAPDPGNLLQMIEKAYGLRLILTRTRVGPHSTVLFLDGQNASFVGKVFVSNDRDRIDESFRLSEKAAAHGCPVVLPIRPAPEFDGRRTLGVAFGERAAWFSLFPFIDGDSFAPGRVDQIRSAGQSLARLHLSGPTSETKRKGAGAFSDFAENISTMRANVLFARLLDRIDIGHFAVTVEHLCHGDYRAQNLIYIGHRVRGIIDFDDACFTSRLWDLAYAIVFFGAGIAPTPALPAERTAFVRAYHRTYALTDDDLERLPSYLCWATVRGLSLWRRLITSASAEVRARLEAWSCSYVPAAEWSANVTSDQLRDLIDK